MALVRIPGPARRYVETTTGQTFSRRAALERLGRPLPKVPHGGQPTSAYGQYIAGIADRTGRSRDSIRRDTATKTAWKALHEPGQSENKQRALRELADKYGISNAQDLMEAYKKRKTSAEQQNAA